MGARAYLMVTVAEDVGREQFVQILRDLEDMPEVDFVDPVDGIYDLVIMIEAPIDVQTVSRKIAAQSWVKELQILRIVSLFERHRTSKKNTVGCG